MSLRIDTAILCDLVRREDNGKLILVGVYGRTIGLKKLPSTVRLTLALRGTTETLGDEQIQIRGLFDGVEGFGARAILDVTDLGVFWTSLPAFGLEFERGGSFSFEWRQNDDQEWRPLLTMEVTAPEVTSPTAPEQPS